MEIKGRIIQVMPLVEGVSKTGNPWKKQEYVLETVDTQYPKKVCFNIFGADRIEQAKIAMNEEVIVSFDLESREYNGRWYTDVRAWKVERGTASGQPVPAAPPADFFAGDNAGSPTDDLPF